MKIFQKFAGILVIFCSPVMKTILNLAMGASYFNHVASKKVSKAAVGNDMNLKQVSMPYENVWCYYQQKKYKIRNEWFYRIRYRIPTM